MAGLWCEHFLEYADVSQLLDGVFAANSFIISTTNSPAPLPRAGSAYLSSDGVHSPEGWRRILGAPKAGAGFGFRYYVGQLPGTDDGIIAEYLTAGGLVQMQAVLGADGGVVIKDGTGATVARSDPAITARTWQYVESKCVPDPVAGSFEVRVNGITVKTFTGDTDPQGTGEVSAVAASAPAFIIAAYADLHAWDTTPGNGPSDFTGNVGVFRRELSGDTATADWTLSSGSTGYALLIDKSDATFIEAGTAAKKSAFQAGALPSGATGILYQQVKFRGQKTDSADCDVAPSLISGADETAVTGQPMTTLDTWRWGIFGDDPLTSAPWTLAAADASDPAVTRTV